MVYRFGDFELDRARVELRRRGEVVPVEPQVFAVLLRLVEHRERLVSRDELIETVWSGRVVSDSALDSRIKSARRAVGDDGKVAFVPVSILEDEQTFMWVDGVADGSRVIVQGQDFVREGQLVEAVAESSLAAQR